MQKFMRRVVVSEDNDEDDKEDAGEKDEGKVVEKKRFSPRDFPAIAEFIVDEFKKRQQDKTRRHLQKVWKEIDRQLRMEPDLSHKQDDRGRAIPGKAWLPELELPLQSQTLEVLTADARRMMSPDSGPWFKANAALTDKYLDRVDFQALVAGDLNEVQSQITQLDANELTQGWLDNFHKQYDYWGNVDLINGEAFKYGMGIGRARTVTKRVFINTAKGVIKERVNMPVLFPRSIKNIYLDNSQHNVMNEGQFIGPSTIFENSVKLVDMKISASKGSNDPKKENGGWMPKSFKGIDADKEGNVQLIEYEGDIAIPRKTSGSIFVPGTIITVLIGVGRPKVVRFRLRKHPFSSYIQFPYHREDIESPYGVSPLMKGMPIQKAATQHLNDLTAVGMLGAMPPIGYDRADVTFAQGGGPEVFPSALWESIGEIKIHKIGDAAELLTVYSSLLAQYADVTGVSAPRLGAQTRSHTTAFAKEAELSRGTVRTVDYVKSTLSGGMQEWLTKEFVMGKEAMNRRTDLVYLPGYRGFVEMTKSALPDDVVFEVFGAGGPAEKQAQAAQRFSALQQAIQIEVTKRQAQIPGKEMDLDAVQEEILREGGWIDTNIFFKQGAEGDVSLPVQGLDPQTDASNIPSQLPGLISGDIVG